LKGEAAQDELAVAQARWQMQAGLVPSRSDPRGAILRLESIVARPA